MPPIPKNYFAAFGYSVLAAAFFSMFFMALLLSVDAINGPDYNQTFWPTMITVFILGLPLTIPAALLLTWVARRERSRSILASE
jgi:protein-S-isoprenylcysteine O-methyltransferase Ste14